MNKYTIFAAVLLSASLLACGAETGTLAANTEAVGTVTASAETEAVTAYIDTLPIQDFGGATFTIIAQDTTTRNNFYHDEVTGEVINDAIHTRDTLAEERLNITLENYGIENRGDVLRTVQKTITAGDNTYDLIITSLSDGINTLTTAGMLYDLTQMPYLTLDSVYWNKSMTENVRIFGKQFFTTGAISPQLYQTPIVMMYNKRMAADLDLPDMYQCVLDGKWTIDKLAELTKDVSADINSDGVMDENDQWGLITDSTFGNALFTSSGLDTVSLVDGAYQLMLDSEEAVALVDRCAALFGDRKKVINDNLGSEDYSTTVFSAGRGLFMDYTILGVMSCRDMKDDFGIIPVPKIDETDTEYHTACNTWLPSGVAVPILCDNAEQTGLIMETLAYYSYETIVPAVYEVTLQGKVARDDASSRMLDIIFGNTSFDFNTILNLNETSVLLRECMMGEKTNFASAYASKQKGAQKQLDKVMEFATEE